MLDLLGNQFLVFEPTTLPSKKVMLLKYVTLSIFKVRSQCALPGSPLPVCLYWKERRILIIVFHKANLFHFSKGQLHGFMLFYVMYM